MQRPLSSSRRLVLLLALISTALSLVGVVPLASAVTSSSPNWFQVGSAAADPAPRHDASMVYDAATGTTLLFGGNDGGYLADTWTWNGAAWTKLSPATSPSPRGGAAITYDATTHSVVLFGGTGPGGYLADTWTWDGTTWTPWGVTGPSARSDASMTYDATTDNIVLFGGQGSGGPLGDTWLWNATSWTSPTISSGAPSPRFASSFADDATTDNIVLFGGQGSGGPLGDTWTWDGAAWSKQSAASPPARYGAPMVFDAAAGVVVLFGGSDGTIRQSDTWVWNGTYWYTLSTPAGPSARDESMMIYDAADDDAILYGGVNGSTNDADTWAFVVPPGPPSNVRATSHESTQSVVTWAAPLSDGGSPIVTYLVSASDSTTATNGGQTCTSSGATTCTVAGLVNGDHYTFSVSATNAVGAGPSAPSGVAIPATLPAAPTITAVVARHGGATLSWGVPATTGGLPITSYRATASPGSADCHVPSTVTSCVIAGLRDGARYTFTITATNAVGTSPATLPSAPLKVRTVPGRPFIDFARVLKGKVVLRWRWPRSNGGSRITGYEVYVGPVPGGEATSPLNARLDRNLTFRFRGRKGYHVFVYVRAVNAAGAGAHSNQVVVYTK